MKNNRSEIFDRVEKALNNVGWYDYEDFYDFFEGEQFDIKKGFDAPEGMEHYMAIFFDGMNGDMTHILYTLSIYRNMVIMTASTPKWSTEVHELEVDETEELFDVVESLFHGVRVYGHLEQGTYGVRGLMKSDEVNDMDEAKVVAWDYLNEGLFVTIDNGEHRFNYSPHKIIEGEDVDETLDSYLVRWW